MDIDAFREGYRIAREHGGILDRRARGRIVVSGRDRAAYLQGLLTNDITALQAGQGCYAAYLTAQGRMITDLWVYELGDVILLTLGLDQKDPLLAKLDQFIFAEDVQLGDVTGTFSSVAIVGAEAVSMAAANLTGVSEDQLGELPEHGNRRAAFAGQPAIVLRVTDTGEPGFEILVPAAEHDALVVGLQHAGAAILDPAVAEALRIEAGIPVFRRDMDEETIPLEAGLESRAISLTKGCYVGQEVIIRVLHRGHGRVARRLVGLRLDPGQPPTPHTAVTAAGREVGKITSSALSPALDQPVALAYLHRDFTEPGTTVAVDGATAVVTPLPFVTRPGLSPQQASSQRGSSL